MPSVVPGGAARRAVGEVVQERAVEEIDVGPIVLTVDAHPEPVRHDRPAVARRVGQHARLQQRQVGVVAAVERQRRHRLLVHQIAQFGRLGVDPHGVEADRHGFLNPTELQDDRNERDHLADRHDDVGASDGLEASQLSPELVHAGRNPGQDEASFLGGRRTTREAGGGLPQRDLNSRQRAARSIEHGTRERGRGLCTRGRDQAKARDQQDEVQRSRSGVTREGISMKYE